MKKLLLRAFALIAAVLPLSVAEAAPKPPKIFGDFPVGKTFTFTVDFANTATTTGIGTPPVSGPTAPKGVPNLVVGQQVTFVIGKKGELIGPGFKIAYFNGGLGANTYVNKPKKGAQPTVATVHKDLSTNEPLWVDVNFFTFKLAKRVPTTTMTNYIVK